MNNLDHPSYEIKDSGVRENFSTGSVRDTNEGKGRFDLLPFEGIEVLARHFQAGSKKYGDRNWEKGQPMSRLLDSALRHTFKWLGGQRDEDHLAAACWNLICALTIRERILKRQLPDSLDDLPNLSGVDDPTPPVWVNPVVAELSAGPLPPVQSNWPGDAPFEHPKTTSTEVLSGLHL